MQVKVIKSITYDIDIADQYSATINEYVRTHLAEIEAEGTVVDESLRAERVG